jgi:hypothetical protein
MTGDTPRGRSIDDVAAGYGLLATLLKPYPSVHQETVRRGVPFRAGARGVKAPLRRYTCDGRLDHPISLGSADPGKSEEQSALGPGRGARACRGPRVRAMVWVCQQLGAQETAPGLNDILRQAARSAEVCCKPAGTIGSSQGGSRSATRPCSTRSDSSDCRAPSWGISAGLRGKSPRRPHTGDFSLWSFTFYQRDGLHPWVRSARCSSPNLLNLFSYSPAVSYSGRGTSLADTLCRPCRHLICPL